MFSVHVSSQICNAVISIANIIHNTKGKITKNAAGFLTFLDKVDWATDREFKRDVYF